MRGPHRVTGFRGVLAQILLLLHEVSSSCRDGRPGIGPPLASDIPAVAGAGDLLEEIYEAIRLDDGSFCFRGGSILVSSLRNTLIMSTVENC